MRITYLFILILIMLACNQVEGVQFTFTESPNITIEQTAVYHCYVVDTEEVTIQWQVNGTSSTLEKVTSLDIVTTGAATANSSLSIPGTESLIGITIVACVASGLVNGKQYFNSSNAMLYVQGKPAVDFECSLQTFFTIKCEWNQAVVISGFYITKYRIKDSMQDLAKTYLSNDTLEYKYNASVSGEHQIAIVPYIDTLEGETANKSVEIDTDLITKHQTTLLLENGTWTLTFELNTKNTTYMSSNPPPQGVRGCVVMNKTGNSTADQYCPFNGTTSGNSTNRITGQLPLESLDDNGRSNITIMLIYSSGIEVGLNDSIELSTFDVQNGSVSIKGPNKVCFNCTFIDGSDASGCQVVYRDKNRYVLGNITIDRMYNYISESSQCHVANTSIIDSVLLYDIESDGSVSTAMPAFELSSIKYFGNASIRSNATVDSTAASQVKMPTSSLLSPTMTKPKVYTDRTSTLQIIIGTIGAIVAVIVIVVIGMISYLGRKKRGRKTRKSRRAAKVNKYDQQFATSTTMHSISVNVVTNTDTYSRLDHSVTASSRHQQHDSQSSSDIYHKLDRSIKPGQQCSSVDSSDYSTLSNVFMESRVDERATSIRSTHHDSLTYNFMKTSIAPLIAHKWEAIGQALGLTQEQIQEIKENNTNSDRAFCDVVMVWSTEQPLPFTWEGLVRVLHSTHVQEYGLAEELKK